MSLLQVKISSRLLLHLRGREGCEQQSSRRAVDENLRGYSVSLLDLSVSGTADAREASARLTAPPSCGMSMMYTPTRKRLSESEESSRALPFTLCSSSRSGTHSPTFLTATTSSSSVATASLETHDHFEADPASPDGSIQEWMHDASTIGDVSSVTVLTEELSTELSGRTAEKPSLAMVSLDRLRILRRHDDESLKWRHRVLPEHPIEKAHCRSSENDLVAKNGRKDRPGAGSQCPFRELIQTLAEFHGHGDMGTAPAHVDNEETAAPCNVDSPLAGCGSQRIKVETGGSNDDDSVRRGDQHPEVSGMDSSGELEASQCRVPWDRNEFCSTESLFTVADILLSRQENKTLYDVRTFRDSTKPGTQRQLFPQQADPASNRNRECKLRCRLRRMHSSIPSASCKNFQPLRVVSMAIVVVVFISLAPLQNQILRIQEVSVRGRRPTRLTGALLIQKSFDGACHLSKVTSPPPVSKNQIANFIKDTLRSLKNRFSPASRMQPSTSGAKNKFVAWKRLLTAVLDSIADECASLSLE
jgi:hypothetical protein